MCFLYVSIYAHIHICLCVHICSNFKPKFSKAIECTLKLQEDHGVKLNVVKVKHMLKVAF